MHFIGLPGFMEIYKIDRTFQAQAPENIDPARTRPDVPWAWRVSDDVGCLNPIVARVFIQCAEALNNKKLRRGDAERIKQALHATKTELRNCEKSFRRLAVENDKIVQSIKEAGGIHIEKRVVNDLPQIANLTDDATLFIACAKRALQHIAEVLNEFYGITISNARFDKGKTQLKTLTPTPQGQLDILDLFTATIERVLNLRNFLDHTPKKTIIENFHLTATAIQPPMWRVDPEPAVPILPEMRDTIGGLVGFAEISFFHGLMDNLDPPPGPFAYVIQEIPEADWDKNCPIRFRCELQFVSAT